VLREKGLDKTPLAKGLTKRKENIQSEMKEYQQMYFSENPSMVAYSFLLKELIYKKGSFDIDKAKDNLKLLSKAHPGHPYNKLASDLLATEENIGIGKEYVDFSAPDLEGRTKDLSGLIDGKIALLDLWATWCGPCIAKSRTMVPVYEKYKDKGFTIIGVAGEFKDTEKLKSFLEKEKWQWPQLVELDRQNRIWNKYGIDNSGGGLILIDVNGKIIAKNPTAEEVMAVLEARQD